MARPATTDVIEYLRAFYHPLPVKQFQAQLRVQPWEGEPSSTFVGLNTSSEVIRIRSRKSLDGIFKQQLNLNDLLDTAMAILPKDAYAIVMLVDHDMYEDDEDDFCCGRAYGGSRVAVVSSARYNPRLDVRHQVELEHAWPASHCSRYVGSKYPRPRPRSIAKRSMGSRNTNEGAEHFAVAAAVDTTRSMPLPSTPEELQSCWLGRVCKTVSHELGHCFGIDHCVYYACIMQGTASIAEDVRQPPYLCPVDLSKILRATGSSEKDHYEALLAVCRKWNADSMFAAFGAWIESRLRQQDAVW